uniref:ATPase_AAA_core domain-containing protein n=1 Tax=Panagrellus redivivus TaxID=6233 RepID=A0A7E4V1E5_PANRE
MQPSSESTTDAASSLEEEPNYASSMPRFPSMTFLKTPETSFAAGRALRVEHERYSRAVLNVARVTDQKVMILDEIEPHE